MIEILVDACPRFGTCSRFGSSEDAQALHEAGFHGHRGDAVLCPFGTTLGVFDLLHDKIREIQKAEQQQFHDEEPISRWLETEI